MSVVKSVKEKLESQYITIFRAGSHRASDGKVYSFSEEDLDALIKNTDLEKVANVIHHPKITNYSFAKVAELKRDGRDLKMRLKDCVEGFAEAIKAGLFPARSIRIANGAIEHVGWLPKGVEPAVKGMPAPEFAEFTAGADGSFEFSLSCSDLDFEEVNAFALTDVVRTLADFMEMMRESIIEKNGIEAADKVVPRWWINRVRNAEVIRRPLEEEPTNYNEGKAMEHQKEKREQVPQSTASKDESRKDFEEAAIEEREKRLAAEREAAEAKRRLREKEFAEFCAPLAREGRLTPAQEKMAIAVMNALADVEQVEFEETTGKSEKKKPLDLFRDLLVTLPKQMDLATEKVTTGTVSSVDFSDDKSLDKAIRARMAEAKCDYATALNDLMKNRR